MNLTTNQQDAFKMAWTDLTERLVDGSATLRDMASRSTDDENTARLLDKAAGMDFAAQTWEDLNNSTVAQAGDFAAVWRTFTDTVLTRLTRSGYTHGYYQGLHLALTYQRGYGAEVDAPVIPNPHL